MYKHYSFVQARLLLGNVSQTSDMALGLPVKNHVSSTDWVYSSFAGTTYDHSHDIRGVFIDKLIKHNVLSTTHGRKLAQCMGT